MTEPSAQLPQTLVDFFQRRVRERVPMALVTVLSTSGSTYSKSGYQMLIDAAGEWQGMLSGGCLEGDLAERAARVIASGAAEHVSYDLYGDDPLFGFGVGCEGRMDVLLQPLLARDGFQPFAAYLEAMEHAAVVRISVPGKAGGREDVQLSLRRPRHVLVLGAGADAGPLLQIAASLGWRLDVYDHRPAYLDKLERPQGCTLTCGPADELAAHLDLSRHDAAIVMSHHLVSDRAYLTTLADSAVAFIGLLGPPHRRDRLLEDLGEAADALQGRLHAPVGRQIGGRGPGAIALEIAAQLQAHFSVVE